MALSTSPWLSPHAIVPGFFARPWTACLISALRASGSRCSWWTTTRPTILRKWWQPMVTPTRFATSMNAQRSVLRKKSRNTGEVRPHCGVHRRRLPRLALVGGPGQINARPARRHRLHRRQGASRMALRTACAGSRQRTGVRWPCSITALLPSGQKSLGCACSRPVWLCVESAIERVGEFDHAYLRCQDHELQVRLWEAGCRCPV